MKRSWGSSSSSWRSWGSRVRLSQSGGQGLGAEESGVRPVLEPVMRYRVALPPQVAVSPWTAHTPPAGTWSTARNRPPL